jgi:hypothetical protein
MHSDSQLRVTRDSWPYFTVWRLWEPSDTPGTQSQSYVTTGGLPLISSSWIQVPRYPRSVFFFSTEHLRLLSLCSILFDERMGLSFTIVTGPRQRSHSLVRVLRDSWPYLESVLLYDWRFKTNQFVLAISPLRLTATIFILQLNTCGYSPYVTSSMTREWVCRLQLLLVLASAVIHRSESRGTNYHSVLSQIRDSPNLEGQVSLFVSNRNMVAR